MVMSDTRKLVLQRIPVGMAGIFAKAVDVAVVVRRRPPISIQAESSIVATGPLNATSSRSFLVLGNDLSCVLQPSVPKCNEGIGIGRPRDIPRRFATAYLAASYSASKDAIPPPTWNKHALSGRKLFPVVMLSKKVPVLNEYAEIAKLMVV